MRALCQYPLEGVGGGITAKRVGPAIAFVAMGALAVAAAPVVCAAGMAHASDGWLWVALQAVWPTTLGIPALGLFALMPADASSGPLSAGLEIALFSPSLLFALRVRSVRKVSRAEPRPDEA